MHKKTSTVISSTRNMSGGFTLIELMIVVTIIAIISAIAVPSYNNYVLRAKRSEGRAALMDVAALQERYYSDCNIYGTLNGPRACGTSRSGITNTQSETGKYNVTLTTMGANNQSYVLTATPTFDDPGCGNLTMTQAGTKNKVGGTDTVNNCWGK